MAGAVAQGAERHVLSPKGQRNGITGFLSSVQQVLVHALGHVQLAPVALLHGERDFVPRAASLLITRNAHSVALKKHVHVLEDAGLVTTHEIGRVRTCRLGPRRLESETAWIAVYRRMLEERLDAPRERVWKAYT
jgi:DNA-binding transcriptional ArsR family regulator